MWGPPRPARLVDREARTRDRASDVFDQRHLVTRVLVEREVAFKGVASVIESHGRADCS